MISKGSAGTRSRLLGKIAGLHVLDIAISRINSDIRAANSSLKHLTEEKEKAEYELEDFPDLWYEQELIEHLEEELKNINKAYDKVTKIKDIHTKYLGVRKEASDIHQIMKRLPALNMDFKTVENAITEITKVREYYNGLVKVSKTAMDIKAKDIDGKLKICLEDHSKILKELGVCPTCKKVIDETNRV